MNADNQRIILACNEVIKLGFARSFAEIAKKGGMTSQYFTDLKKNKSTYSRVFLDKIIGAYPINKAYVLTGEGEMLKNNATQQTNNIEPLNNAEIASKLFEQLSTKDDQIRELLNLVKSQQETISMLSKKSEDAEGVGDVARKVAQG